MKGRKSPNVNCLALLFCALVLILTPYLFFVWQDRSETRRIANFYIKREEPHVEVRHLWRHAANHRTFFVFDIYQAIFPTDYDPNSMDLTTSAFSENVPLSEWRLVLAEGAVPGLNFTTPYTYATDLQCVWSGDVATTPKFQFLRYKNGEIDYRQHHSTPFSYFDAYLTQFILCPLPSSSSTSLVALQSVRANYLLDLKDTTPVPTSLSNHRIVMCMAPLYGSNNVRWLIEWLEYHRALGIAHVHVPVWDDEAEGGPLWTLLRFYHDSGFITIHHWSEQASDGFTKAGQIYERAKYGAWNDCYLRNRGHSDWAVFLDIDELLFTKTGNLKKSLEFCDNAFFKDHKVGCSMSSHTITSVYKRVKPFRESNKLLLEEYDFGEVKPKCPFNCGKFHPGRSKYLVRTRELWLPPIMLWTHALGGRDYEYADKIMVQVPAEVMNVHHYQAWWYTKDDKILPEALVRAGDKIPNHLTNVIRGTLEIPMLREMYLGSPRQHGVGWLEPLFDEKDVRDPDEKQE